MERQFPSDKCITDCLRDSYDIAVKSITPLAGGADMNAVIYKVQADDRSIYFVKLKHGSESEINPKILGLLQRNGVEQIIPPIETIQGDSILHVGDFCLIIYPFIEGVNGFSHKLSDEQWITLGKALRQVHDFEVPPAFLKHIRQETYSPKWRQAVRSLYTNIQNASTSHDAIALKFLNFIREHRLVIQRLVERAEQLCGMVKDQPVKLVLCHSDIHGGNVLLKGRNTIYIVDWDAPIMAPKERDLMFIGGGVANVWNNPHEEESFYKGYGETKIDKIILAYYRHERIVEDIAEYGQALLLTPVEAEERPEMYKHFIAMFEPRGVIDIAFKTDQGLSV